MLNRYWVTKQASHPSSHLAHGKESLINLNKVSLLSSPHCEARCEIDVLIRGGDGWGPL